MQIAGLKIVCIAIYKFVDKNAGVVSRAKRVLKPAYEPYIS